MIMKKTILLFLLVVFFLSCSEEQPVSSGPASKEIEKTLNTWHKAAAEADFETYFSAMTEDAVYIGTDATENWNIAEFKTFAKPHFEKGKAWDFTALERNIYFSKNGQIAWFDELLKTWMGLCRGSGILVKEKGEWKIKHYVLSMTIPNPRAKEAARMKSDFDNYFLKKYSARKNE